MALKHRRATIVYVSQVSDPNGKNPKDRPVVLVRDYDENDTVAYGVAITGSFDYPIPASMVKLPYHRGGKCKTGLTKECVAVSTWVVEVAAEDMLNRVGFVPDVEFAQILQLLHAKLGG